MGTIVCNLNGAPQAGVIVVVVAPPLDVFINLGGYNAIATTGASGTGVFPDPSIWNLPGGSQANVIARYTDPATGQDYYAQATWQVTGYIVVEYWNPDPLSLDLVASAPQPLLDQVIGQVASGANPPGTLDALVKSVSVIAVAGLGIYAGINLVNAAKQQKK